MSFHCPIWDSAYFGKDQDMYAQVYPILADNNISLLLNGHDHHYERLEYDKFTAIVLGSGGAMQDPFLIEIPPSEAIAYGPSYANIEVNLSNITITCVITR